MVCIPKYSLSGRNILCYRNAWVQLNPSIPSPPLDNVQVRTALCWVVWHSVHSQQHTYMSSSYRSSRLGPLLRPWRRLPIELWLIEQGLTSHQTHCRSYRGRFLQIMTWWSGPGGIQALSERPTGFLQYFDAVGLVIWPVKLVPEMTYNVLSVTLSL